MPDRLNYRVEITPTTAENAVDVPSIGLFGSKLTWVTNYDATYTASNSARILADDWVSPMNKSAVVNNSGNTAVIGGGTLYVIGSAKLLDNLDSLNVTIYNALVTIAESRNGGAYEVIRTGVISQEQDEISRVSLKFEDVTKSYNTTITKEIGDSGKFYPVNIGVNDTTKTVPVDTDFDIPQLSGRVPVFEIFETDFDFCRCTVPYSDAPTDAELETWEVAVNQLITGDGKTIAVVQNGKKRIISSAARGGSVMRFNFAYGDDASEPFTVSSAVADYLLVEPLGQEFHTDYFGGEFISTDLQTEINDKYATVPTYIDQTSFGNSSVLIADQDGAGWVAQIDGQVSTGVEADQGVLGFPVVVGGSLAAPTDGDPTTELTMRFATTLTTLTGDRMLIEGYKLDTKTPPSKLILCGLVELQIDSSGSVVHTYGVGCRLRDQFGNEMDAEFATPSGLPLGDIVNNPIPTLYGVDPSLSESEGFLWGSDAMIPDAGVLMEIDLTGDDFTGDIQWAGGVDCDLFIAVRFDPSTGSEPLDVTVKIKDLRIFSKEDYSADDIYCNWQGRQKYNGVDYISTVPEFYEHAIQLQDYGNRGETTPTEGWGKVYPVVSDWTQYYDESTDYGGLYNSELMQYYNHWQILDAGKARTDELKKVAARLSWGIGSVGRDGVERLFPMIEGLSNTDGVQIRYIDIIPDSIQFRDKRYTEIFALPNITYNYDPLEGRNTKSIIISQVEQTGYDPSYVTGVTSASLAQELWNYGRVIYKVWSTKNEFPTQLQDCGWITEEGHAIEYIKKMYQWQGAFRESGLYAGKERYVATFSVPYTFGITNGLDVGSKIRLAVPNRTYTTIEAFHSGIVTGVVDSIGGATPSMKITAEMLGGNLAGSDESIIVQGTDSENEIIQGTDSTTEIVQGES